MLKNVTCELKDDRGCCIEMPGASCAYTNITIFGQEEDCGLFLCVHMYLVDEINVYCKETSLPCKETKGLKKCVKLLAIKTQKKMI
jgi:hypothetical protein